MRLGTDFTKEDSTTLIEDLTPLSKHGGSGGGSRGEVWGVEGNHPARDVCNQCGEPCLKEERCVIELMTSGHTLQASREGSLPNLPLRMPRPSFYFGASNCCMAGTRAFNGLDFREERCHAVEHDPLIKSQLASR